jgi:catechol 2,3-dioxygenase-like lactoylglutathione lyase family enzyme
MPKMIRIKKLDHIVIRAKDAERLVEFYCSVLGCTVERKLSPDIGLVQLRAGDALIDVVAVDSEIGRQGGTAPGKGGRNMDHFCVRLETFKEEAIREHLARHNVKGSKLESRYGAEGNGPSIYIQDPEGNTVELKGPPNEESI